MKLTLKKPGIKKEDEKWNISSATFIRLSSNQGECSVSFKQTILCLAKLFLTLNFLSQFSHLKFCSFCLFWQMSTYLLKWSWRENLLLQVYFNSLFYELIHALADQICIWKINYMIYTLVIDFSFCRFENDVVEFPCCLIIACLVTQIENNIIITTLLLCLCLKLFPRLPQQYSLFSFILMMML